MQYAKLRKHKSAIDYGCFHHKISLDTTILIWTPTEDGQGSQQIQKICLSKNTPGEEQEGQRREHLQTVYFYYETQSQSANYCWFKDKHCKETGTYTEKMYRSVQKAPHGDNT